MSEVNDPWIVKEAKKPVPVGMYLCDYGGVEDFTLIDKTTNTSKVKWRWLWKIKTGTEAGKEATAITDREIKPTTLPGRLIQGLLGRPLTVGENIKAALDSCVGKPYMVNVEAGPQGGKAQVRSVGKPPQM